MNKMDLQSLAAQIHTPCYVFDLDAFRCRAEQVRQAFGDDTGLCFSIKANPFLLCGLPDTFDKIEVCSPGELAICEALHMDMGKVIFSGVNKSLADVERAMDDGVGVFTAESTLHLEYIHAAAQKRGIRVPVLLRLTAGSQFGIDQEVILQLLREREYYPHVQFLGLHFFSGTQKRKASVILRELDTVMDFVAQVRHELGFTLECLEYGTGLAVDFFSANADASEEERLTAVAEKIREISQKIRLSVEMGRFFSAPCGYYFTRVVDTKQNMGIHYAIVDGGLHQLKYDGQIQGMQLPVITHLPHKTAAGEELPWTICGSLCTTADILARNSPFSGLVPGDILVFHRTGAYSVTEGMALFLSRDLPQVCLYSREKGLQVLREPFETHRFQLPSALVGGIVP